MDIKPPSIIVIGDTVSLRNEIAWFEKAPLFGKSVLVTRARAQASVLIKKLNALGADAIELPTIAIEPAVLTAEEKTELLNFAFYHWIFFTSQNAVEPFFKIINKHGFDTRALSNVRIASIGPSTSDALRANGINPDLEPEEYTSSGLLTAFATVCNDREPLNILLPRADIASKELPDGLRAMGHDVTEVPIYRTDPAEPDTDLIEQIKSEPPDFITFASSSTAENLANMLGHEDFVRLSMQSKFISIGPVTSAKIRKLGAHVSREAARSDINGLVEAIIHESRESDKKK